VATMSPTGAGPSGPCVSTVIVPQAQCVWISNSSIGFAKWRAGRLAGPPYVAPAQTLVRLFL
jgi:hypothetical protein